MASHIAVVGGGYWGKNLVRNFAELGALRTVCDSSPLVEANVLAKYPGLHYCREYAEVLSDENNRGVVLATPAALHFEMARRALLAGKDVFVEKPLSLRVAEGEELVELADKMGSILMVGHILHYHPAVRKLKELVNSGSLGRIEYAYSNRLNLGKIRAEENILWSFAPHDISVLLGILETMYMTSYPARGFACTLAALGGSPAMGAPTPDAAQLLQPDLASGYKAGYLFKISTCTKSGTGGIAPAKNYIVTAVPVAVGKTGNRGFCYDQEDGVLRYDPAGGIQ